MKKILISFFVIVAITGCEDFLDVNQDLDSPETSTPNYLLPAILGNMATSMFDHGEAESYITQYVATFNGFDKYKDRWDWVTANRVGMWRRHYHDISINIMHMIQSAERENAINYIGVGKIMYAFTTQITTDVFGDMPFSNALQGNPSPSYDSQEDIYNEIFNLANDGIDLLQSANPATLRPLTAAEDHVFKGDLSKWIRFAHAVKARALNHLTPHYNTNYNDVIAEVDLALNGWSDAGFDYSTGNGSDLQTNQWGQSRMDPGWDYAINLLDRSAPTPFFLSALGYDAINHVVNDPRQPLLFQPNVNGEYLSIAPSEGKVGVIADNMYPYMYGSYMTKDDAVMPFIFEEELHFIKAEAAFRSNQVLIAYSSFINGISRHMRRVGVNESDIADYLAGPLVPQNPASLTLSHIMMQKYIALYLQGETWVDMRRLDYDNQIYTGLKKPVNLAEYWNAEDATDWIERLPYDTETEEVYNKPALVELGAFQNPNWLKVPMIWSK